MSKSLSLDAEVMKKARSNTSGLKELNIHKNYIKTSVP